ncbi:2516_t:CDS:2, partial [Funneliformis mosseae]
EWHSWTRLSWNYEFEWKRNSSCKPLGLSELLIMRLGNGSCRPLGLPELLVMWFGMD